VFIFGLFDTGVGDAFAGWKNNSMSMQLREMPSRRNDLRMSRL